MINTTLYRLAIGAYAAGIKLSSSFNPKAKLFVDGRKGLLQHIAIAMAAEKRPCIWMHCASLGEFEQGRPVLEAIRYAYPQYALVLTFFSPSGYEVRKDYSGADHVFYLPVDSPGNADAFLNAVQPKLCLFVKYELWYYYLAGLAQRNIPTLLVSAIFTEKHGFFKWYGGLQRQMLKCFSHIFVQDENSKKLLQQIHVENVSISGDTRFDRVIRAAIEVVDLPIAATFAAGHSIVVAGSTWPEDEVLFKEAFTQLPADWKLIVVPHNVDASHIASIETMFCGNLVKWSAWSELHASKRILLVDTVGMLMQLYNYATVAYIGGGFGKAGVHNVLEPAVYGKPCIYGPIYHQFIEAGELIEAGGASVVNNAAQLGAAITEIGAGQPLQKMGDAAKTYVRSKRGATARVMEHLGKYLQ